MAQAREDERLIEALIKNLSPSDLPISSLKDRVRSVSQSISSASSSRVNQFEVSAKVDGLVEKLQILNRDDVAEALQVQWRRLQSHEWEWTPEVLTLLLQLSDRPSVVTQVIDGGLAASEEPESSGDSISERSSVDNESGIWSNVDFRAQDSDDFSDAESLDLPEAERDDVTAATESPVEQFVASVANPSRTEELNALKTAYWKLSPSQIDPAADHFESPALDLTELQVIREVIFMLLGLPSSVFSTFSGNNVRPCRKISVKQLSSQSLEDQLQDFAKLGTSILKMRKFSSQHHSSTMVQRFQSALASRVTEFDNVLNQKQAEILDEQLEFVVSLLALSNIVYTAARCLLLVTDTVDRLLRNDNATGPFCILEDLYQGVCAAQGSGDTSAYRYLARFFFECFDVYQQSLKMWMEEGVLIEGQRVLFIKKEDFAAPLEDVWHRQFSIIESSDGHPFVPNFMKAATKSIFNTGKAVHFLKLLGDHVSPTDCSANDLRGFDYETESALLVPFEEAFDSFFSSWVSEKHHHAAEMLRQRLEQECGLHKCLEAIQYIYLCKDSTLTQSLLVPVFERLEHGRRRWDDPMLLTDNAQGVLAAASSIESTRVAVKLCRLDQNRQRNPRSMDTLARVRIEYSLPWPVANIIRPTSMESYQHVFVLISQLQRAKYLLQRQKLPRRGSELTQSLSSIYHLRLRLLTFTNAILTHLLTVSHDTATSSMRRRLASAVDLDGMIAVHTEYIEELKRFSFLKPENASLKQAIVSILDLTVLFSDIVTVLKPQGTRQNTKPGRRGSHEDASSSDSEGDLDPSARSTNQVHANNKLSLMSKSAKLRNTFGQLHGFVLASVRGLAKSDGSAYWEILASNLATLEIGGKP